VRVSVRVRRDQRREFWRLVRSGVPVAQAAGCLGFDPVTGRRWFYQAGGVTPPAEKPRPRRRRWVTIEDREQILAGIERGDSIRAIARRLDRHPSVVSRELRANLYHQRYRPRVPRGPAITKPWRYSPHRAQLRADRNRSRPKAAKLAVNPRLREEVQNRLNDKHSPEQISRRLRVEFPDDAEMRVSHETIYQSIYVQGRGALRRELAACLRTGRAMRKPHYTGQYRRGRIKDMVNISERPAEVVDRAVPGHWEGDLILGKENKSAIGTLVERTTGFVDLLHLPGGHGAVQVQDAMIDAIRALPQLLRKTVTWDQGLEMAHHAKITLATDVKIYFCDPASPWQRPINENTNGLLRQYFPKGTDLSGYHPDYLAFVANQLNDRPRKRLDWRTPKEALNELLSPQQTDPTDVAKTG
jgi:transposase, IS30 family